MEYTRVGSFRLFFNEKVRTQGSHILTFLTEKRTMSFLLLWNTSDNYEKYSCHRKECCTGNYPLDSHSGANSLYNGCPETHCCGKGCYQHQHFQHFMRIRKME